MSSCKIHWGRGLCPSCKIHGGGGGIMSMYTKISREDFVRGGGGQTKSVKILTMYLQKQTIS